MNGIDNGIDGWEADQFYRVVLAMITAVVVAVMLTIFSAVAEPTKGNAVAIDRTVDLMPDLQRTSSHLVATEWW